MVVGVDVELPEQLFPPGRERFRADRADVDERHQASIFQTLFGADRAPPALTISGSSVSRRNAAIDIRR